MIKVIKLSDIHEKDYSEDDLLDLINSPPNSKHMKEMADVTAGLVLENLTLGVSINSDDIALFYLCEDGGTYKCDIRAMVGEIIEYIERIQDKNHRIKYTASILKLAESFIEVATTLSSCAETVSSPNWTPVDDGPLN